MDQINARVRLQWQIEKVAQQTEHLSEQTIRKRNTELSHGASPTYRLV